MSRWCSTNAREVLACLLRLHFRVKRALRHWTLNDTVNAGWPSSCSIRYTRVSVCMRGQESPRGPLYARLIPRYISLKWPRGDCCSFIRTHRPSLKDLDILLGEIERTYYAVALRVRLRAEWSCATLEQAVDSSSFPHVFVQRFAYCKAVLTYVCKLVSDKVHSTTTSSKPYPCKARRTLKAYF
jgi:hypothetical protein